MVKRQATLGAVILGMAVVALTACGGASKPAGVLSVRLTAVAGGRPGTVRVSGPGGYARTLTSSTTLNALAPGTYTLSGSPAPSTAGNWWPTTPTQIVAVAPGATSTADMTYTVEVAARTRVVAAAALSPQPPITSASAPGVIELTAAAASSLAPGDILTAGSSPTTPNGLLRTVVALHPAANGQVAVQTQAASLRQAVPVGDLEVHVGPGANATATRVPSGRVNATLLGTKTSGILYSLPMGNGISCGGGQLQTKNTDFSLAPHIDFSLKWGWFQAPRIRFSVGGSESLTVSETTTSQASCTWTTRTPAAVLDTLDIQLGIVPVVIVIKWDIKSAVTGTAASADTVGFSQNASLQVGASEANGKASPIVAYSNHFTPSPPTQQSDLALTTSIGPEVILSLYDVGGPYAYLSIFGTRQVGSGSSRAVTADILAGFSASVGLEPDPAFKRIVPGLPSFTIPNVIKLSSTIYQHTFPPVSPSVSPGAKTGLAAAAAAYGSSAVASAPVTATDGTIYALVAHDAQGSVPGGTGAVAEVLGNSAGSWHHVATVVIDRSPGNGVGSRPSSVAHLTGATDVIVPIAAASVEPVAVVSDTGGHWHAIPFDTSSQGRTDVVVMDQHSGPQANGTFITAQNNCNPACASGTITYTTYRYNATIGAFVRVASPSPPSTSGGLQHYIGIWAQEGATLTIAPNGDFTVTGNRASNALGKSARGTLRPAAAGTVSGAVTASNWSIYPPGPIYMTFQQRTDSILPDVGGLQVGEFCNPKAPASICGG